MTFFIEYDMPTDRRMRDDLREIEARLHSDGNRGDSRQYLADASLSICQTGDTFVVSLMGVYAKAPVCLTVTGTEWQETLLACHWVLCKNFKVDDSELPF